LAVIVCILTRVTAYAGFTGTRLGFSILASHSVLRFRSQLSNYGETDAINEALQMEGGAKRLDPFQAGKRMSLLAAWLLCLTQTNWHSIFVSLR